MQHNIYALCDYELLKKYKLSLKQYLDIINKYPNIKLLQYRDKINPILIQKQNLSYLKQNLNIPVIINDKLELIEQADGLHIGQEDLKELIIKNEKLKVKKDFFKWFKTKYPDKIIGLSTHNKAEILQANSFFLDYIGLGAYRATSTKKDVSNILDEKIVKLIKLSNHKVAVIGGVRIEDKIDGATYLVIGSNLIDGNRS